MKHVFIVNPMAGQGKGQALEYIKPKIEEVASKYNLDYEIIPTTAKGDGQKIVKEVAAKYDEVRCYACGGDGTLYEVVNGAYGLKNVQVTVVPLGSGNDFIRLFGNKETFLNLDDLVNGVPVELDLINNDGEIAINQCSMGMDAEVCRMQGTIKKYPFVNGEFAYTIGCIYAIIKKFKNRFTITIDDGEPITYDCLFCFIGNARYYGGGYKAAPLAQPDDQLLDFVVVESKVGRIKLAGMLNKYKRGEHLDWDITHFVRGKKLTIHSEKPATVNVDGECRQVFDTTFELIEKGITFVVPRTSQWLIDKTEKH